MEREATWLPIRQLHLSSEGRSGRLQNGRLSLAVRRESNENKTGIWSPSPSDSKACAILHLALRAWHIVDTSQHSLNKLIHTITSFWKVLSFHIWGNCALSLKAQTKCSLLHAAFPDSMPSFNPNSCNLSYN